MTLTQLRAELFERRPNPVTVDVLTRQLRRRCCSC
jgi:hypothetical protein